jgi:hypothetical protein
MHVRRTLAALLAAPCLLSACGGGSSVADPPVSSHPTSSAPTIQPPTHESPEHFIRRWAAAEKRMENTGKTGPYLAMSQGCESCTQLANDVSNFYSAGGYVRWDGWQIVSIKHYADHGHRRAFACAPARARPSTRSPPLANCKLSQAGWPQMLWRLHARTHPGESSASRNWVRDATSDQRGNNRDCIVGPSIGFTSVCRSSRLRSLHDAA